METKFTDLEKQYIVESMEDGGYIDDTYVNIDRKQMRGVISSLIKKGIIGMDFEVNSYGDNVPFPTVDWDELQSELS